MDKTDLQVQPSAYSLNGGTPTLPLPEDFDHAKFGRDFLTHYFAHGFGSLTKKEIELQIFKQLSDAGVFQAGATSRLQQISIQLRLPITRVRSLTYEMQLRSGVVSDAWFREKLLTAIQSTQYRRLTERIEFGVEDPMLRAEIEGRLKREGRFPDYGMSREILHLGLEDFSFLLEQILSADERQVILDRVPQDNTNPNEPKIFSTALRLLINAAAQGAGDEIGRGGARVLLGFLTGGIDSIERSIAIIYKKIKYPVNNK